MIEGGDQLVDATRANEVNLSLFIGIDVQQSVTTPSQQGNHSKKTERSRRQVRACSVLNQEK